MQVSFQHANPWHGRESHLVRFHDVVHDETTCLLVDAGEDVDVDELLGDDEYLSGILLTHAHLDHYQTLGENLRDEAAIYATPETAATIEQILTTNDEHVHLSNPEKIEDALTPVEAWTTITPDVRVHPVPAGHAPGAAGFVVQFDDGTESHHLLATGDFTTRSVAGYPGIPTELPVDVDGVFLTAATSSEPTAELTETIRTIRERATAGSTVLTTASSLTGVHLAWLLAHLAEEDELAMPVTLVGRTATLWEAFGYDEPSIETVSTFADPNDVLDAGRVTIAGPEVPVAGSAEALFDHIADDPGATLVQVTSGAFDPETGDRSRGTVYDFQVSAHPTEETIDDVVEALDPVHVVITHQQGSSADQYKDKYDSFVWACEDDDEYTLYDDEWVGPPWVTEATVRRVRARQYTNGGPTLGESLDTSEVPLPTVDRHADVTLADEGIDVDRLVGGSDSSQTPSELTDSFDGDGQSDETETSDQSLSEDSATDDDLLQKIDERIAQIEEAVVGQSARVRVVDAGDGVTLLRPIEDSLGEDLIHGEVIEVTLSK